MQAIEQLIEIMDRLRDPASGCPWDLKQNFHTILPYTLEEAYEVADAIEGGDMQELRDELGDLLFQVVFHARMAKEQGEFDFNTVAEGICQKMLRRHPHVFGDADYRDDAQLRESWEKAKRDEREAKHALAAPVSQMDGVAGALPAPGASVANTGARNCSDGRPEWASIGPMPLAHSTRRAKSLTRSRRLLPVAIRRISRKSSVTCCSRWST